MTGSISQIPPIGPQVPSGTTLQEILGLISTSQTAYNDALTVYNVAKTEYTSARNYADSTHLLYQQNPSQQKLDDYTAAVSAFQATIAPWQQAVSDLHNKAATYVTNLAYQQIYWSQTCDQTVATALSSILSQTIPPTESMSLEIPPKIPPLPWLTTSQIQALKDIAETNAPNTQLKEVLGNLLTAFMNYRHSQWQVASLTNLLTTAQANLELATHNLNLAIIFGTGVAAAQLAYDNALGQKNTCQTNLSTATNEAIGIIQALDNGISAYENVYNTIKNLGTPLPQIDTTVQTIITFCLHWNTDVVQAAQTAVSDTLREAMLALTIANDAMMDTFKEEFAVTHPGLSAESVGAILSQLAAIQSALSAAGIQLVESITIPQLPPATSSVSLIQLMNILGQAELTSEELIRLAAAAEHQITALRLQFAISHLMLYGNELASLDTITNALVLAQIDFNIATEEENKISYNSVFSIYNTYRDHIDDINDVIDEINTKITEENARCQALVDEANDIDEAVIQAIFSEQLSYLEAPNYLLNYYQGITSNPPSSPMHLTFTPIPLFEHVSITDLPAYTPSEYPGRTAVNYNTVSQINQNITNFLLKIAPFTDLVEMKLETTTNSTTPLFLSQILLKSFLPVDELTTQVELFKVSFSLLIGFLSQTVLSQMDTKSQDSSTLALLEELYQILGMYGKTMGAGGSIGIGGSLLASAGDFGIALSQVVNSSIFLNAIKTIVERAAMLAGLDVAGTLPEILKQLADKNMTLSDLLELEGEKAGEDIEAQTRTELLTAFMQQLALAAGTPGSLQQGVIDILSNFPRLATLSKEDLTKLISGVITVQQMILLSMTIMLGVTLGLSPGQLATTLLSSGGDLVSQLMSLGIPQARAIALASAVAGMDEVEAVLTGLGFDATTRTMLMAVIASAQGNIPLTDGAPGGPAFLDTLLLALKDRGITITADISSPEFINQLTTALGINANEQQRAILEKYLLGKTPSTTPPAVSLFDQVASALNDISKKISEIFSNPPPQTPPPAISPITPSAILGQFTSWYKTLDSDIQKQLIDEASKNPALAGITGLSDEQKASVMLAMRLGLITPSEATSLVMLVQREAEMAAQGSALILSNFETELITRLFTPTADELRQREENKKRDINRPNVTPSTLPPQVLDQVSIAFRRFFNNIADTKRSAQAYEEFAKTIQKLSNFNKVALDFLLDPAKIIMRQFSIITRTAQDKVDKPKITLTG